MFVGMAGKRGALATQLLPKLDKFEQKMEFHPLPLFFTLFLISPLLDWLFG
jgi:hypothetical protein